MTAKPLDLTDLSQFEGHTPGPYSMNYNAVGKSYRLIGADGYGAIAEVFTEANAAMLAQGLNERDALLTECKRQREQIKALREAASAVAAMLGDTPRDRLGRLDVVATATRETVRKLAVRYGVVSGDYMDQCSKVLRAALKVSP